MGEAIVTQGRRNDILAFSDLCLVEQYLAALVLIGWLDTWNLLGFRY